MNVQTDNTKTLINATQKIQELLDQLTIAEKTIQDLSSRLSVKEASLCIHKKQITDLIRDIEDDPGVTGHKLIQQIKSAQKLAEIS